MAAATALSRAAAPAAAEIMARVAANQDRGVEQRKSWVYVQKIRVQTRRTNGRLVRQEIATYSVTPGDNSSKRTLTSLEGKHWHGGKWIEFHSQPAPLADTLDGSLIHGFRDDLMDERAKDGLANDLFPLTTSEQAKHTFRLLGEQDVHGRRAWRVEFRPLDKDEIAWAGEALIDEQDAQPLSVFTKLSRRIPVAVRTLLGTDVPGIGFNVTYERLEDGSWFPASFGTEFRLHAIFVINRLISVSLENMDFRHTAVDSNVEYTK